MRRLLLVVSLIVAAGVMATGAAAMSGGGCSSGLIVKSKSYVFALDIGPLAHMYTEAQVKADHPKSGEVMFTGKMSGGMNGMGMSGAGARHLEVHICTPSGAVVMHAHPTIVITDPKAKTMSMSVPIVTMEGIGEGSSDYHYGNNVELTPGDRISVTVTLNGQKVVFHTKVSKSAMSMG